MAQRPTNETHALQIQAGALGRAKGHEFEEQIARYVNEFKYPIEFETTLRNHLNSGEPSRIILNYIASICGRSEIKRAIAISTGTLATSEAGKKWLEVNGVRVTRCKCDIVIVLRFEGDSEDKTVGVSTKQCNTNTPTNAQLYFTTAIGFVNLLRNNGFTISTNAVVALRQFCGDTGFRPSDSSEAMQGRQSDPRRYFWEEVDKEGRVEWENLFSSKQDEITKLLLQKAYLDDPFTPDVVIHKTKKAQSWQQTEVAIYTVEELIQKSHAYAGFRLKPYSVKKGRYRDPDGIQHLAPRFGIVQMQRGGQVQHPQQLQFNLEAGYFYKI